jgi:hypothetical protein
MRVVAFASLLAAGCLRTPVYECASATECERGGEAGVCEPTGFCSFADASCPSGRRYGGFSGTLSGVCVGEEPPDASNAPDADPDDPDGPPTIDGSMQPDAPQTYVEVESLTIPSNGNTVTSSTILTLGAPYRLRASGTFIIQSGVGTQSDAEYWDFAVMNDGVTGVDIGIAVDDTVVDETKNPDWGPYDPSHVYEIGYLGTGAAIVGQLHDGNYANNTGSLTLTILALQ